MNNSSIYFSVITVSFNSVKTIERTILSLLHQTVQPTEYIIVDGGSTDGTIEIIEKYISDFAGRLRYISESDTGIYNAMNKGLKMAKGDVIGIVNSDDWLEKNALEILLSHIEQHNLNVSNSFILTGWMNFHYKNGEIQVLRNTLERFNHYTKKKRMGLNHPATFISKRTYEEIGLFDEELKLYADADFILRCYTAKVRIDFINASLSNMADEGASNRVSVQCLKDRKYILLKHSKSKWEYYSFYFSSICHHYIKALLPIVILKKIRNYAFR